MPSNVPNGTAGGRWLMATSAFTTQTGLTPDFTVPAGLFAGGGMVCWGALAGGTTNPNNHVDCLAYGNYSGPSNIHTSAPTTLAPDGHSLQRVTDTDNNSADFVCAETATPTNNVPASAMMTATTSCTAPDEDDDGVPDADDDCAGTAPGAAVDVNGCAWAQVDNDLDGACDSGASSPSWCTGTDNCESAANASQADLDGDTMADACDPNMDGDAMPNASDPDDDNDGVADAAEGQCGDDADSDGNGSVNDGCPQVGAAAESGAQCANAIDDDGDGWINDGCPGATEINACGASALDPSSRPERTDGAFSAVSDDGDALIDEALPPGATGLDCDGDGFTGAAESHLYLTATTADQDPCGTNQNPPASPPSAVGWPLDLHPGDVILPSANSITAQDFSSFLAPVRYLDQDLGDSPGNVRWDLIPGPGVLGTDINAQDLNALLAGATATPPMLGGDVRGLSGPDCPWPP
jgi:hypothetical protein